LMMPSNSMRNDIPPSAEIAGAGVAGFLAAGSSRRLRAPLMVKPSS